MRRPRISASLVFLATVSLTLGCGSAEDGPHLDAEPDVSSDVPHVDVGDTLDVDVAACGASDEYRAIRMDSCGDGLTCAPGYFCWEDGNITCHPAGERVGGACSEEGSEVSGLLCQEDLRFVDGPIAGRYTWAPAPSTLGGACDVDADCPDGSACTDDYLYSNWAAATPDQWPERSCSPSPGTMGGACETDTDCPTDAICARYSPYVDHSATTTVCAPRGTLVAGEPCYGNDALCQDGLVCRPFDLAQVGQGGGTIDLCNLPCD